MSKKSTPHPPTAKPAQSGEAWQDHDWAAESTPLTAAPRLATTISVRFEPESALLLRRAARLSGRTKSEFIRQATVNAARDVIAQAQIPRFTFHAVGRSRSRQTTTTGKHLSVIQKEALETATFSLAAADVESHS